MMRGFATFYGKHRITRGTKWSNIILSEAKNIISPRGDASLRIQSSALIEYGSENPYRISKI